MCIHLFNSNNVLKPRSPFTMDFSWSTCFICLLAILPGSVFVRFLLFYLHISNIAETQLRFFLFPFLQIPWDTSISRWTMHFLEPYTSELVPKSSARLWQLTKSRIPSPLSYDLFNRTSSALTWSCATWLRSPRDPLLSPTERNHNQVIWFSAFVHL